MAIRSHSVSLYTGTAAEFTARGLVLGVGEMAREIDTGVLKTGDGSTGWASLAGHSEFPITDEDVAVGAAIARTKVAAVEDVRVFGAVGQPAYTAKWAANPNPAPPGGFWYDPMSDLVYLSGEAKASGGDPAIFDVISTLPAGYCPTANITRMIPKLRGSTFSPTYVTIASNGGIAIFEDLQTNDILYLGNMAPFRPADA